MSLATIRERLEMATTAEAEALRAKEAFGEICVASEERWDMLTRAPEDMQVLLTLAEAAKAGRMGHGPLCPADRGRNGPCQCGLHALRDAVALVEALP